MSDVFVSYKAEDRRRVQPLVKALASDGLSVWWDPQIGGGAAWRESIEQQLESARCVLVIWSKRSVGREGRFVRDEASRAERRGTYLPVLIDRVEPPLGFGETQAVPLIGWKGDPSDQRYSAVLAAVRSIIAGEPFDGYSGSAIHPRASRRTMIAGGVIATAAAASGAWILLKPRSAGELDSIAVLPFANLSGDPAQAYFSDGIAEELRSALSRLAGLKVVGRTSSEAVRNDDAETAARKLDVANILTGSVRQSPSTIRVNAQLIDGRNGIERWSQTYDRAPGDAIKIQTDIAENVARALSITLGSAGQHAITIGGTENAQAQQLLFQAIEAARRVDRQALQRAISLADAAIKLDPEYADAYAHKALFQNWYARYYVASLAELIELRAEMMRTAKIALRLAPGLPTGHRALAEIYRITLDITPALREYGQALELAPSNAGVIRDYAYVLNRLGRTAESIELADRAIALDPLDGAAYWTKFQVLEGARSYQEALRFSQDLERTRPHLFAWPEGVGWVLIRLGRYEEAEAYLRRAPEDSYRRLVGEVALLARTGRRTEVPAKIANARQLLGDTANYQYAEMYAQLGNKDRAFAALDRAWQVRDSGLLSVKVDWFLDPLRDDPRFTALLAQMNFPA